MNRENKMFRGLVYFCVFVGGICFVGCVSLSKHEALEGLQSETTKKLEQTELQNHEQKILIADLESKLGLVSSDNTELKKVLQELTARKLMAEKRLSEYTEIVKRFRKLIDAGKLRVKIVKGRMVVELSSDILFRSGSSQLSVEGREHIAEVAQQLSELSERSFQIEGHTDNVPIHTDKYDSNWELASKRAIQVIKEMIDSGMPPERISGATFGQYHPIGENSTSEGRETNRRIEIVVIPDLSSLPGHEELEKAVSEPTVPTEPESTEPESTEPESTEPESTEPESTEPESTEPESTEPESTEPESTEPESSR